MTRPLSGGAAGAGGGIPTAAQITSTPTNPDSSTNVQGTLDWLAAFEGDVALVHDRDQLIAHFGLPVAGEFVITLPVKETGPVALLAGEYLTGTGRGWMAPADIATATISGDVAGGLIRGSWLMRTVVLNNANVAGWDADVSAPMGGFLNFQEIQSQGAGNGIRVSNAPGVSSFFNCAFLTKRGLVFDGAIGLSTVSGGAFNSTDPASIGFEITGASSISAFEITSAIFFSFADPAQIGITISPAASAPDGAYLINNCRFNGVGVSLDPASVQSTDVRVISRSNDRITPSVARASYGFRDTATPVAVTGPAGAVVVVPWTNGVTSLDPFPANERFRMVDIDTGLAITGATAGDKWALEYLGPEQVSPSITYTMLHQRGVGGSVFILPFLEVSAGGIAGVFTKVDNTLDEVERLAVWSHMTSGGSLAVLSPGDWIRFVIQTVSQPADSLVGTLKILVEDDL